MGVSATSKVVTSSDTIGRAILIQPGNREWSTVIECINATGKAPPVKLVSGSTR
ncbi:hypothetical protein M501DRAFT_1002917 [Patellaria atrata CBS 101060]|uniref:Uncharacterized protein n=1 Tax=Patellaria atrata CBS 101060 TaxID=1346257 RepID=A0A9P4VPB4_9PEZI|nr:hypothetical protein M501DRAFT_1004412 [Patellaria atrata CBS 101060]KAF2839494.1 hypothetical protein M501DRAFT_1002917 [Patellaria atrata CBS 101060]